MKFVKFRNAHNIDEIPIPLFVQRLPQKIVDLYINKRNPYKIYNSVLLDTEGFQVVLPYTTNTAKASYRQYEACVNKTIWKLLDKGVKIAVPPEDILFPNTMRMAQGKIIFALFLKEIAAKALGTFHKELRDAEVLILDGNNFLTELIIDSICSEVNFLSIYTDREAALKDKMQEIYNDCGLQVQMFANSKNMLLKDADIIINGAMELENYDYFFKKGTVYLDANKNRQRCKRLLMHRNDMLIVDSVLFTVEGQKVSAGDLEAVAYVASSEFREFVNREYHIVRAKAVRQALEKKMPVVTDLLINGEPIIWEGEP